uniref:Uncharacterized protein n=1 Tax=Erwinia amylovora ATCC BAA-2158 TaxID=889211 RepID=E5B2E6_ERWAM|nr:hypothetical protein predicted by Glimmer/Critica [Erwinia amylovora ATCC BAA-2158]
MISNISPANKSHIDDMQHQYAMASINSKSQTANSVINITNANSPTEILRQSPGSDSDMVPASKLAKAYYEFIKAPSQNSSKARLFKELYNKNLPSEVANAKMSEGRESIKNLLGMMAGNINNKKDNKTLQTIYSQLIAANGDAKKESKIEAGLKELLVKYGKDSLKGHVAEFKEMCRDAWKEYHKISSDTGESINDNLIFSESLEACENVIEKTLEGLLHSGADIHSLAQYGNFFSNGCSAITHTLLHQETPDSEEKTHMPEPNNAKPADPPLSSPPMHGQGAINIHVEGSKATTVVNGDSLPTQKTLEQDLISLGIKLLGDSSPELKEHKVEMLKTILNLVKESVKNNRGDGFLQNLQEITQKPPAATAVADLQELNYATPHNPPTEGEISITPLINSGQGKDTSGTDPVISDPTEIDSSINLKTERLDLKSNAARKGENRQAIDATFAPLVTKIHKASVETPQALQVANSSADYNRAGDGINNLAHQPMNLYDAARGVNDAVRGVIDALSEVPGSVKKIQQPLPSQANKPEVIKVRSDIIRENVANSPSIAGGNNSGTYASGSNSVNPVVHELPAASARKMAQNSEQKFIQPDSNGKNIRFNTGGSASVNNSGAGVKDAAGNQSQNQDNSKIKQKFTVKFSPRIHTTVRTIDPFNNLSSPSRSFVQQFNHDIYAGSKDKPHNAGNNIAKDPVNNPGGNA